MTGPKPVSLKKVTKKKTSKSGKACPKKLAKSKPANQWSFVTEAFSKTTAKAAKEWFAAKVESIVESTGATEQEASALLRAAIGYLSGYYGVAEAIKAHEFYGSEHPVFKSKDYFN